MKKMKILTIPNVDGMFFERNLEEKMNEVLSEGWSFIPPFVVSPLVVGPQGVSINGGFIIATFEKEE